MIGINVDMLNSIINRTSGSNENFNVDSRNLSNIMANLEDCYNGSVLNFLFSKPSDAIRQLDKIKEVLSNRVDILSDVKKSYIKQNDIFSQQLNHMSSNL